MFSKFVNLRIPLMFCLFKLECGTQFFFFFSLHVVVVVVVVKPIYRRIEQPQQQLRCVTTDAPPNPTPYDQVVIRRVVKDSDII